MIRDKKKQKGILKNILEEFKREKTEELEWE